MCVIVLFQLSKIYFFKPIQHIEVVWTYLWWTGPWRHWTQTPPPQTVALCISTHWRRPRTVGRPQNVSHCTRSQWVADQTWENNFHKLYKGHYHYHSQRPLSLPLLRWWWSWSGNASALLVTDDRWIPLTSQLFNKTSSCQRFGKPWRSCALNIPVMLTTPLIVTVFSIAPGINHHNHAMNFYDGCFFYIYVYIICQQWRYEHNIYIMFIMNIIYIYHVHIVIMNFIMTIWT